jgi:inosose dehydratase
MNPHDRIAAAPISWGVCEVPGWGAQMTPDRVLAEMRALGIRATEAGPVGYLGTDPEDAGELVGRHGLHLLGGFVPAVLHRDHGLAAVERAAELFATAGADVVVLAALAREGDYDSHPEFSEDEWRALLAGLDAAQEICAGAGLRCALHPHVGTVIERPPDVERVLADSHVQLCLDTGHLLIGGNDPVALARAAADRVSHVHLKDVDAAMAERVLAGGRTYSDAVRDGLYRPLGAGDVDVRTFVALLEGAGYDGWYVLEQDVMLDADPPEGAGPLGDVRASADFLRSLLGAAAPT